MPFDGLTTCGQPRTCAAGKCTARPLLIPSTCCVCPGRAAGSPCRGLFGGQVRGWERGSVTCRGRLPGFQTERRRLGVRRHPVSRWLKTGAVKDSAKDSVVVTGRTFPKLYVSAVLWGWSVPFVPLNLNRRVFSLVQTMSDKLGAALLCQLRSPIACQVPIIHLFPMVFCKRHEFRNTLLLKLRKKRTRR